MEMELECRMVEKYSLLLRQIRRTVHCNRTICHWFRVKVCRCHRRRTITTSTITTSPRIITSKVTHSWVKRLQMVELTRWCITTPQTIALIIIPIIQQAVSVIIILTTNLISRFTSTICLTSSSHNFSNYLVNLSAINTFITSSPSSLGSRTYRRTSSYRICSLLKTRQMWLVAQRTSWIIVRKIIVINLQITRSFLTI